jgi:hypothetical protein
MLYFVILKIKMIKLQISEQGKGEKIYIYAYVADNFVYVISYPSPTIMT